MDTTTYTYNQIHIDTIQPNTQIQYNQIHIDTITYTYNQLHGYNTHTNTVKYINTNNTQLQSTT